MRKPDITWMVQFLVVTVCIGAIFGSPKAVYADASRIVSINLCTDELLTRLADPIQIAGLTHYPKTKEAQRVTDENGIPTLKGSIEEVMVLNPDLVLAGSFTHKETVALLHKIGIPVVLVRVPQNFEQIYENIRVIAKAIGRVEEGDSVILEMQGQLREIPTKSFKQRKVLFMQSRGYVPGAKTFENEIIEATGAINLAGQLGIEHFSVISLEKLILAKPDIIIFPVDEQNKASLGRELLSHPAIRRGLHATQKETISPRLLNCGSPASVEAVKVLSNLLRKGV